MISEVTLVILGSYCKYGAAAIYGPFGEALLPGTTGSAENLDNSYNEALGWAADPTRKQESLFTIPVIQMG